MGSVTSLPQLSDLDDQALRAHYAPLRVPWFRLNFVATIDGAAQGPDGLSGSINNAADKRVFHALRDIADVVIVGAGTARAEGYRPNPKPMVVVSRSGEVPPSLRERSGGDLMMATCDRAPHLEETRSLLGDDNVLVLGEYGPDLPMLRRELVARGFRDLLCEGGPHLTRDLLAERRRRRAVPHHGPAPDRRPAPPDHRPARRSTSGCGCTHCSRTTAPCWQR